MFVYLGMKTKEIDMENFKGTKGRWNLGYKTVKVNEHSLLFMPIYKTVATNKVIAVAYSEHGHEYEVKANAQLIAHAPEMLTTLDKILRWNMYGRDEDFVSEEQINGLLTRATTI